MYPDQQAPLILTAMTLHGIGSYIDGARLEIKPLTVLCGQNGSGKSTWLKVLHLLQRSLELNRLPWGYDIADRGVENIQVTNAFFHVAPPEVISRLSTSDTIEQFGPPTTIGLEIEATRSYALQELTDGYPSEEPTGDALRDVLWHGVVEPGMRLRVRIAHPSYWNDDIATPSLFHLIELSIDDQYIVRLKGERDSSQQFSLEADRPQRKKLYQLYCSPVIVPGTHSDEDSPIHVASVRDVPSLACESAVEWLALDVAKEIVWCLETRLKQILREVLEGFFYLAAVRQPTNFLSLKDVDRAPNRSVASQRHVGTSGEHAWLLERRWHDAMLRDATFPQFDRGNLSIDVAGWLADQNLRKHSRPAGRVWDLADPKLKDEISGAMTHQHPDIDEHGEPEFFYGNYSEVEVLDLTAELLNRLVDEPRLFKFDAWALENEDIDDKGNPVGGHIEDPEIAYLADRFDSLSPAELRRLNYLLIVDALGDFVDMSEEPIIVPRETYALDDYVSFWMSTFTNTELLSRFSRQINWPESTPWIVRGVSEIPLSNPTGMLLQTLPNDSRSDESGELNRTIHPCFGESRSSCIPQPPRQSSAGFHQLFPMVVQLGLMRAGEIFGIENPEVHLHPALQLRMVEALIGHVGSGRRLIVETHSDLLIRRIIRAILEEGIAQSQVQIYFTDLLKSHAAQNFTPRIDFYGSRVAPIAVDERGRIANWPEGFLDEDMRESQRLLDIMYGGGVEGDDDE